jgi:hypothetical protein
MPGAKASTPGEGSFVGVAEAHSLRDGRGEARGLPEVDRI